MIESAILFIEQNLIPLGIPGLFAAAFIEEIVAPIPSALVMLSAGFFFLEGGWSVDLFIKLITVVILPISLGMTLGAIVIFGLVRKFGDPFVEKFGFWLGISREAIDKFRARASRGMRDEITIGVLRVIPAIPSVVISAACGLLHIPLKSFVLATFLGTTLRAAILALIGWQAGDLYSEYAEAVGRFENIGLAILLFSGVLLVIYKRMKKQ